MAWVLGGDDDPEEEEEEEEEEDDDDWPGEADVDRLGDEAGRDAGAAGAGEELEEAAAEEAGADDDRDEGDPAVAGRGVATAGLDVAADDRWGGDADADPAAAGVTGGAACSPASCCSMSETPAWSRAIFSSSVAMAASAAPAPDVAVTGGDALAAPAGG
ncbi:MAG TPA: hypothetical protein VFH45_13700 [Acidimicrobiales bacterium]|nr:hypothetical protein [Acidimicrobiales bacterium]